MRILGIIPARGGSKGIPHKNRKLLGGKPLLYYTIDAATASNLLDEVIFSSDDDELITLAEAKHITIPFKRPKHLATDGAGSLQVVQHAITFLKEQGQDFDAVCLLQVTTPFRAKGLIDAAISKFKISEADSLVTVQKVPHQYNPHWVFEDSNGLLKIATGDKEIIKRRQELPDSYIRDGAIYITKVSVIMNEDSFFGVSTAYLETDADTHVNIDTNDDWIKAEQVLKQVGQ